jgi:hypothetical protein
MSEIGNFEIINEDFYISKKAIKGFYINPTMINIAREPFSGENSVEGKIIAVIPDLMMLQVTILVSIIRKQENVKKNNFKVLRIQMSSSECDYQISDTVYLKIDPEGIKLYNK